MALKQPNTICKNRNCTKGKDGGRKHYYTCRYCVHSASWRSVACCEECYDEYMKQVAEAREHNEPVNLFPERTDMSQDEVRSLVMDAYYDDVVKATKEELSDEMEEAPGLGFGQIVDRINEQLDEANEEGGV